MSRLAPLPAVLGGVLLAGCALFGGSGGPDHCEIRVLGVENWQVRAGKVDVAYRVGGQAGSRATTWLSAKVGEIRYLSGGPVEVGPGPFQAIVDLRLTGLPRKFVVVLEVAGKRCHADAPTPRS